VLWLRQLFASLLPWRPRFDPGPVSVGFVVDKMLLGQVFLLVLVFLCQYHFTGQSNSTETELVWIFADSLNKFQICSCHGSDSERPVQSDNVLLQLQDLNISTYTGPRSHDTPIVETPLPEEASQLSQPFLIHYVEGKVVGLSVKAGEQEWSINMKRGLVSLLQLDLLHLQSSAFISTEVHYLNYFPKPVNLFKAVIKSTLPAGYMHQISSFFCSPQTDCVVII